MVILFGKARGRQAAMRMKNRLGKTGRAGREINRRFVFARQFDFGSVRRTVGRQRMERLGKRRTRLAEEKQTAHAVKLVGDRFHAPDKFGAEDEKIDVGQSDAIFNFVGSVAEIERHGDAAGLQHAKINREPFEAIHQKNPDFIALLQPATKEQVRKTIRKVVELRPGRRTALSGGRQTRRFDKVEVFPRDTTRRVDFRIDFNQTYIGTI